MNDDTISGGHPPAGNRTAESPEIVQPQQIGRYRIERLLGQGGFGVVYLAHDERLQRLVAIKVPHRRRVPAPKDAAAYLTEAQIAAGLDHPNIVPVYDVGSTEDWPCYIVTKYVDGTSLAEWLKVKTMSPTQTAELLVAVAGALHYAHGKGLVHRDVKPGNVLIGGDGTPFVADFGLASKDEEVGNESRYAGTPAYMSPEQARGEGHRIDGRSDIFSLGVVFYELLTGRRPFNGASQDELLEQVRSHEPSPPRQYDERIPKELERICMKALAKRASERYSTAKDLAGDLRHWIDTQDGLQTRLGTAEPKSPYAPGLVKDIFLSHASADKEAAARLCQLIEARGVRCWIAPRDVLPGDDYGESIIRAIEDAPVTVLLLSAKANASTHVKHEIERATSKSKRIIPVRLEDIMPGRAVELHLSTTQWIDAFQLGLEQVALQLVQIVSSGSSRAAPARVVPPSSAPSSQNLPVHIVPKGLRSFDAHDADFFLELLPGPRDRDGLPDSIRFWKLRIEEVDHDHTFAVGLIYGPSGCGKSSLVKAGLLPRLSDRVIAIYVEATGDETEARLLNGLRKRCPGLPAELNLKEALAAIRRGTGAPAGKKVLIVLDQFEQWLHSREGDQNGELVEALRQCDGSRVQCIVMVRDDFWLAVSRFLRELEIRLVEGENSALTDLFDTRHARKVLAAFGRAFGRLPEHPGELDEDSKRFLNQAVSDLAEDGKVIPVRLALFAEMMKGRAWTPASLKDVGGTEGVGVTFLEETFSSASAPPEHRYHQKAAKAILKSLLPESGTDIKGHMRSYAELLEVSGYSKRPDDFDGVIRILDSEIRLLTPTDPEGKGGEGDSNIEALPRNRCFQLTHDYLVPAVRVWLTRKQKETRRGRAELLLADRAAIWIARKENRQLPSFLQWLNIWFLTAKETWTPSQHKLMDRATRYHAVRGSALALLLAVATVVGVTIRGRVVEQRRAIEASGLVNRLIDADTPQVPVIIADMVPYRKWVDPLLRGKNADAPDTSQQKLHTSLALLPSDSGQVDYLYRRLLAADPHKVMLIRDALFAHRDKLIEQLWRIAEAPQGVRDPARLRAAAALAKYDPEGERWARCSAAVVHDLVQENPIFLGQWSEAFSAVRLQLLAPLQVIFRDSNPERFNDRNLATNLLADYAFDRPQDLAEMLMDADERQYPVIFPKFKARGDEGLPGLLLELEKTLPSDGDDSVKEKLAKRQANAAVSLLKMNQPAKVWPLFKHRPDPRARSYLVHRLASFGVPPKVIVDRLGVESDLSIRRALILGLGEYRAEEMPPDERQALTLRVQDLYKSDADSGIHAAAAWLLRTWKQNAWLQETNELWSRDGKKLEAATRAQANPDSKDTKPWYLNSQGQTMVVIPGPVEFLMGSPPSQEIRDENERQHLRRIGRTFALAAQSVTVEQFRQFEPNFPSKAIFSRMPELPVTAVNWHQAAAYCNWLSAQEHIPEDQWCYEAGSNGEMMTKKNCLSLTGYRLPTEAEMEFATRAGASTSRSYGETDELLPKYAWYIANSEDKTWPVGQKKPNDFGLFDLNGNVWCWCQDHYAAAYPQPLPGEAVNDSDGDSSVDPTASRVLRGGGFNYLPKYVRSAYRYNYPSRNNNQHYGFRVARTVRVSSPEP